MPNKHIGKYEQKFMKYKKKYINLTKKFYNQYAGGDGSIKYVASILLHKDDHGTQILLLQRNRDDKWMTPGGHVEKKDYIVNETNEQAYKKALKREFYEETGFEMPKLNKMKEYVYNKNTKLYIGYIDHIDMGDFKSNNEAHSIGLFSLDMLRKHDYKIETIPLVSYVRSSLVLLDKEGYLK